ncbi:MULTISPECIES: ABA4-like family protein [unclassified Sphingomonas]|uniref:ABA4-like family protein n=1 Tax=unclassified Sphingomonas TaxID=196159 RepID=UPI000BC3F701|nr:MAG: hypothetical protein B7Z43_09175 [Sphingomonas sp. 12-62-6]OYX40077.1 MAG: hypothetical protein B7Y98_03255 [Sphingomonas sp. 32-62-10]
MNWPVLFQIVNTAALVLWLVLILAPRWRGGINQLRIAGAGGLSLFYVVLITTALTVGFGDSGGPAPDFTTIAGIRAIFGTDGGVVTGWTHYLALDLFTGLWIAEDADRRGMGRVLQAPILALTFLAGPAGLFLYLAVSRLLFPRRVV